MAQARLSRYFKPKYGLCVLRTLFVGPLAVGVLSFALLAFVPQIREVYLGIFEEYDYARGAAGFAVFLLFAALIYAWHSRLAGARIDRIYADLGDLRFDRCLLAVRDGKALVCAALPLAGVLLGLYFLGAQLAANAPRLEGLSTLDASREVTVPAASARALAALSETLSRQIFLGAAIAAVLFAVFLGALLWLRRHRLLRRRIERAIMVAAGLVAIFAIAAPVLSDTLGPLLSESRIFTAARALGPLAATGLTLVAALALIMGLSWVSEFSKVPVISILVTLALLLGYQRFSTSLIYGGRTTAEVAETVATPEEKVQQARESENLKKNISDQQTEFEAAFRAWLQSRADREAYAKKGLPYPVFIIAAPGGGIYATSAAAAYLSILQDRCENFSQHVFAVSAVSGGAVGTAIFDEAMATHGQVGESCRPSATPLSARLERIVLDDHLSPWVVAVLPDILRKSIPLPAGLNRASALEDSFGSALKDAQISASPYNFAPCEKLGQRKQHNAYERWCPNTAAPAVILNATWVETGYRVAFSPFPLRWAGDGTLFAFSDLDLFDRMPLMQAAMVSARFPLIVPAKWEDREVKGGTKRANFVDGGYADSSGATTALDLFRAIDEMVKDSRADQKPDNDLNIDLRLILLTDAISDFNIEDAPNGSGFDDTVSPLTTVFNVRALLARRAVTQALLEVGKSEDAGDNPNPRAQVFVVKLDQSSLPLPLGWKISRLSNNLVKLMMGSPHPCPDRAAGSAAATSRLADTVVKNGCTMRYIVDLLSPAGDTITTSAPR